MILKCSAFFASHKLIYLRVIRVEVQWQLRYCRLSHKFQLKYSDIQLGIPEIPKSRCTWKLSCTRIWPGTRKPNEKWVLNFGKKSFICFMNSYPTIKMIGKYLISQLLSETETKYRFCQAWNSTNLERLHTYVWIITTSGASELWDTTEFRLATTEQNWHGRFRQKWLCLSVPLHCEEASMWNWIWSLNNHLCEI